MATNTNIIELLTDLISYPQRDHLIAKIAQFQQTPDTNKNCKKTFTFLTRADRAPGNHIHSVLVVTARDERRSVGT